MWYCENCKNEFDEPDREKKCFEDLYEVSTLFYERNYFDMLVCPFCGSDEIEEMRKCDRCEEYCREDDLTDTEEMTNGGIGYLCPDCMSDCEVGC